MVDGVVTDVEYVGASLSCELKSPIGRILMDLSGTGVRPAVGDRLSVLLSEESIYFVPADEAATSDAEITGAQAALMDLPQ